MIDSFAVQKPDWYVGVSRIRVSPLLSIVITEKSISPVNTPFLKFFAGEMSRLNDYHCLVLGRVKW